VFPWGRGFTQDIWLAAVSEKMLNPQIRKKYMMDLIRFRFEFKILDK
jgi:hypothetical protein